MQEPATTKTIDIEPAALLEMSPTTGISQVYIKYIDFFQGKPLNGCFEIYHLQ